jgi:hypothetical protein
MNRVGFFLCVVGGLVVACSQPTPFTRVTVEFIAPKGTPPLAYVMTTSGLDKHAFGHIEPGDAETVKLFPGGAGNEVTLIIDTAPGGKTKSSWTGQRFPSESSYQTHIQINEEGEVVSQRSCVMPCEL